MTLTQTEGDVFALDLPALGHGCNCRGSMAGGIARDFRARYPAMHAEYVERCRRGVFTLGGFFAWVEGDVVIYNLATQLERGADARLDAIRTSVAAALDDAQARGLSHLGIPRIGSRIGGLSWPDVEAALHEVADERPVELVVVTRR